MKNIKLMFFRWKAYKKMVVKVIKGGEINEINLKDTIYKYIVEVTGSNPVCSTMNQSKRLVFSFIPLFSDGYKSSLIFSR